MNVVVRQTMFNESIRNQQYNKHHARHTHAHHIEFGMVAAAAAISDSGSGSGSGSSIGGSIRGERIQHEIWQFDQIKQKLYKKLE